MALEFGSQAEAQAALDDWLSHRVPTRVQVDLASVEAEHRRRFEEEYGRATAQLYIAFDQLVALVDQVNFVDKAHWPRHRVIQFVLVAKNLKAFHSALDRLIHGSYQDAMTVARSLYEAFLRSVHVSIYSAQPSGALTDAPGKGIPAFNATGLVRDVLRLDWRKYGIFSPFAHSNLAEVQESLRRLDEREGEPERFGLSYDDDARLAEALLSLMQFLILAHLRVVRELLIGSSEVPDPAQVAEAELAIEWTTFLLVQHPKPYWTQVTADLDYVLRLLAVSDSGGDWKALRNDRALVIDGR